MGGKWGALIVLGAAQFLMVLDQSVMNVSISQLVADFDTDRDHDPGGDHPLLAGDGDADDHRRQARRPARRKRVFAIGLVIYGCGSFLTAVSWSVPTLALGWSVLEGIGAAMVMPALVALVAGSYSGAARTTAYGVLGGVAGAGIAVGPILGGWLTTNATWRLVFAGEVVIVIAILLALKLLREPEAGKRPAGLDWVGSVLSALGLGLIVFGVLQASNWGWLVPRNSPIEPFGFSLVPFVVAGGGLLLWAFRAWERRREDLGREPLVRFAMFANGPLRSGLAMFLSQNLILLGIFFVVPLYLQVVQGFDAFETGVQMLPVSITMLLTAMSASRLARWAPRSIVRVGLGVLLVADVFLLSTIDPDLDTTDFCIAMGILGVGLGLLASQLGNVVQSAVTDRERSEAGGLQYTAQQLGAALGTALAGAVLISGLIAGFTSKIEENPAIAQETSQEVGIRVQSNVTFLSSDQVAAAATDAGLDERGDGRPGLRLRGHAAAGPEARAADGGLVVVASFAGTRRLPDRPLAEAATAGASPQPPPP